MNEQEFQAYAAFVTEAMREHTRPYVASISRVLSETEGSHEGSGAYVALRRKPYLLTNQHIAAVTEQHSSLAHILADSENAVRITNPFQAVSYPIDVALTRIEDQIWNSKNEKRALPIDRFAKAHRPAQYELLFMTGFSGQRSRYIALLASLISLGTPYLTQETVVPPDLQSPFTFALLYHPDRTTSLDPNGRGLPDPHGFSGSLVWDTKAVASAYFGQSWAPDYAEVTGIIWGWSSINACLLATRVEYIREFSLRALRQEAAYFHWLGRNRPESDGWTDWFWAVEEIPDLT